MFSCKMNKGIPNFKNVFDLYGQIGIEQVCFDIKKFGIYIYTTYDKSIHTMASFLCSSFLEYKCEKDCIFTLNIKSMKENLKNITSVDTIELSIKKEQELLIKVTKKTVELERKIKMVETQFYDLPIVLDQVQPLNIKSTDFLELCRSISGKYTMSIKTSVSKHDENVTNIEFESEKSKVIIKSEADTSPAPFEGEFKAEYFSKLKKFAKFNSNLRVYTSKDQPLIFETNIGTGTKDKDKITIWIKSLKQMEEDYNEQEE